MAKGKDNKKNEKEKETPPEERVEVIPPGTRHIRIILKGYSNIKPTYSISDLTVSAKYLDFDLGTSSKTEITDEDYFSAHYEYIIEVDLNSSKDLDQLISNPVIFTVYENPGKGDPTLLTQLEAAKKTIQENVQMSVESAADLADAFAASPMDRTGFILPKEVTPKGSKQENKKDVPATKSEQTMKNPKGSKAKLDGNRAVDSEISVDPVLLGTTTLDMVPLFLGNRHFSESLLIHQTTKYFDDQLVPVNIMPRLVVDVQVDESNWFPEDLDMNILSFTVESIYNLPSLMSEEMHYKVATLLPTPHAKVQPVIIAGGKRTDATNLDRMKQWPNMAKTNSLYNATKYRLDDSPETIKNKTGIDIHKVIDSSDPRIEWNILKRNFFMQDATREVFKLIKKYRHLPLEIYVTSAKEEEAVADSKAIDVKGKSKSDASVKKGAKDEKPEIENYLHLMTAIDVATLLYPGVKTCRIACSLNTYQETEILKETGQRNSYFMPKQANEVPAGETDKAKGSQKSDAKSKDSKGNPAADSNKRDLKPQLTIPIIIIEEPSTPVYNEKGERTFIIVEIELLRPLIPRRTIEDLSEELYHLLPKHPGLSKSVVSTHLARLQFEDTIKQLTQDLIHQHQHYLKEKEQCICDRVVPSDPQTEFITFLQRIGVYQTYLLSITKAASVIVDDKFPFPNDVNHNSKEYQNFISEVYCALIKEMNSVLNELINSGTEVSSMKSMKSFKPLLLYAREACEIGATLLADRYYLEVFNVLWVFKQLKADAKNNPTIGPLTKRICRDNESANQWFDYAIFQLEMGDRENALECLRQGLLIDAEHHYSLLLFGILLTEKNQYEEAETCFLTAIFRKQNWLEGWGTLHLFYSHIGNREGADLSLEMINKCFKSYTPETDYFATTDDLIWTTAVCPNTTFFLTTTLLLKMRAFTFAEKALVHVKIKHEGLYHYYLAVIMYYRHNYEHALAHLQEAERIYGLDYAIGTLKGHCYMALDQFQNAKEEYMRVLESYNRPDDLHMLFVYLALISEKTGDKQFARKLMLLTCKYSPTPYTWLACGLLYFGQKDLISAEQCLIQANLCDNRLPEIWGYLMLINVELHRYNEAELCYKQTLKNKLENAELMKRISNARTLLDKKNK